MTNKPMLSVERELLERLTENWNGTDARIELRALLDKPVVERDERADFEKEVQAGSDRFQPDFRRYGLHPDAEYKCANNQWAWELWQKRASMDKPAAQHQDYPVNRLSYSQGDRRYVNGWNDACSHWEDQTAQPKDEVERLRILVDSKEVERQQCIEECSAEIGALRTQLAEQPAPVALVMPERELYTKYLVGVIPHNAN